MDSFAEFRSVDGFEVSGTCDHCEKRGVPVLLINERYFGDGSVGRTETATICERCLSVYIHRAAEVLSHELRAMFARRSKVKEHETV